ncbi:MAG: cobalamin-independent methionine synthase II family protein [Candidatus Lambdaproteobacteria bacterium]|nr:cobalamin-independent methionine synthase II family protein [Candidatus Lambdaproteobacteria bacterium]
MTNGKLLPTTVIGSHALPSWLWLSREAMAQGRFGQVDVEETLEDATRIAIQDQLDAGVDVISDGEMRRVNFIVGFYGHLRGIATEAPPRRMGAPHWDTETPFQVTEPLTAPEGLGVIADFRMARAATGAPMKATCPGPITLSIPLRRGSVYATQQTLIDDLVPIVNRELKGLVEAGADFIQIDEPNMAMRESDARPWIETFNRTVEGVKAKIALHICFGNLNNKPFAAPRTYRHLFPHVNEARADQLVLEFANREMGEIALLAGYGKEVGLGVIDVKAFRVEPPEVVAERIRTALHHVPAERLWINPDCGFWDTPRWICKRKLRAMVEGARLVRERL